MDEWAIWGHVEGVRHGARWQAGHLTTQPITSSMPNLLQERMRSAVLEKTSVQTHNGREVAASVSETAQPAVIFATVRAAFDTIDQIEGTPPAGS